MRILRIARESKASEREREEEREQKVPLLCVTWQRPTLWLYFFYYGFFLSLSFLYSKLFLFLISTCSFILFIKQKKEITRKKMQILFIVA
jgi:hypothetical protein